MQKRIEEYKSRPLPDASERKLHKSAFGPVDERDEEFPSEDAGKSTTTYLNLLVPPTHILRFDWHYRTSHNSTWRNTHEARDRTRQLGVCDLSPVGRRTKSGSDTCASARKTVDLFGGYGAADDGFGLGAIGQGE